MDLRLPAFLFCGRVLEGRAVFVVFLWLIGVARTENVSCPKAPAIRSIARSPRGPVGAFVGVLSTLLVGGPARERSPLKPRAPRLKRKSLR